MKKICVIYGGLSPEHDISIITGMQLVKNINSKFSVEKVYLGLDNKFYLATDLNALLDYNDKNNLRLKQVMFYNNSLYKVSKFGLKKICDVKSVINCCHGGVGENGDLAGFFSTLDIPYTSANSLASHIAMDKSLAKLIVSSLDIPVVKGIKVTQDNIDEAKEVITSFSNNLIVKPNSLGSSIGVKACTTDNYMTQVEAIFELKDDALVEERIVDLAEYNQACFIDNGELILSAIEEPILRHEVLTFNDKYTGSKTKGRDRTIPARIAKNLEQKINEYTKQIYKTLNMHGVVRIDYIYDKDTKQLYFNEINTIPGSMSFYLYEPFGVDYITLIKRLVDNSRVNTKNIYLDTNILKGKNI